MPKLCKGTTVAIKGFIPVHHQVTREVSYGSDVQFSRGEMEKKREFVGVGQGMSERTLLLQEAALQENRSSRFRERNL